jgi:diguanylate cyclase (GGDEF)-like protein
MTTPSPTPEIPMHIMPRLLIVDDQAINLHVLYQIFSNDYEVFIASSGAEALAFCQKQQPDLILLDVMMPHMDGYEVCRLLKTDSLTRNIPIIFVTANSSAEEEEEGLSAGAVDFITRSTSPNIIRARVKTHITLKQQTDKLRTLALIDGLTGVANRRQFDHVLAAEWRRCTRANKPLSLVLIDIDFFKRFNDTYGHQAGDVCLQQVAMSLKTCVSRAYDLVARYGGEEFVCLMPETPLQGAEKIMRSLQNAVTALMIPHTATEVLTDSRQIVTISLGLASITPHQESNPEVLLLAADRMLYAAKQAGRGQGKSVQLL